MTRTSLQIDADRHAAKLRTSVAEDLRRLREDVGVSQVDVARVAGVTPSFVSRVEAGARSPTMESYARIAAALGAEISARVYPQSGPKIHDRHQVRMGELLLGQLHPRWRPSPEVAVRRPVRGWIDLVLHDPAAAVLVAAELESGLHRIEQLLRWSTEKASALGSASMWPRWTDGGGEPTVSRLLVIRWTRLNREAVADARRALREAYPADPRDAIDALTGSAGWPGAAVLWARIDDGQPRLCPG